MENKMIGLICWVCVTVFYFIVSMVCDFNDTWLHYLCNYIIIFCQGGIICNYIIDIFTGEE